MTLILGTPVVYTHRAAVARLRPRTRGGLQGVEHYREWELMEGARKNMRLDDLTYESDLFGDWKTEIHHQRTYRGRSAGAAVPVNKTIMVWPEEGSGIVTGLVRRGIGRSESGYHSGPDGDWSEGYFSSCMFFELYVVRHQLRGLDYYLVPQFAVSVIHATG